jgi:hypothetical protein
MRQRGERRHFALEAREGVAIGRQKRRQHLDRDVASQPGVAGAVDLPHPAGP